MENGKRKGEYAVVTLHQMPESSSLIPGTNVQLAELIALIRDLQLNKGQKVIFTVVRMIVCG